MQYSISSRTLARFTVLGVALFALAALSAARVPPALAVPTTSTSVNIVNNSSRDIRNVYLSHVNADDWGADQLTTPITAGQSFNLTNLACDQQQVKVIGEDTDGCFLSTVVTCGSSATWTVTNDTSRDCGN
jgi:hypothetical protein